MEEQLKHTLAGYLKIEPSAISNDTVIDRSALGNSILLHRLYAAFSQQGYSVSNYNTIRTFGELKSRLSPDSYNQNKEEKKPALHEGISQSLGRERHTPEGGIGVDVENVEIFEVAQDYREHSFYKKNFTDREISYCLLQSNARASFAGLFAAKEALVKADNSLLGTDFNAIEISHDKKGKPFFKGFLLSISHTDTVAMATAFRFVQEAYEENLTSLKSTDFSANNFPERKKFSPLLFLILAVSITALFLAIFSLFKNSCPKLAVVFPSKLRLKFTSWKVAKLK